MRKIITDYFGKIDFMVLFFLFLLFSLFFFTEKEEGFFYQFSMQQMEIFCSSPEAKEIFDVNEEEAKEVFGDEGDAVFL